MSERPFPVSLGGVYRWPAVIDPTTSLAFAVQSQPGVYAVLVGSGVSRAAQIPTGWGIVNDLIRRLAATHDDMIAGEPAQWYEDTFGTPVGFSSLLALLATVRTERQALLRGFIEPHADKPDERRPTAGHRALARLARSGHIRVFITTNFDRLLEQALADEGVTPLIVANAAAAAGAPPFHHEAAVVFKIHGDYLEPESMLVTEAELAQYAPEIEARLARTLEDYGLIVCGWSADWDPALRKAVTAARSRRYPLYFAARDGKISPDAQAVIDLRGGTTVKIDDADTFFELLHRRVYAIDRLDEPHPLDTEALVAAVKAALPRPERRIELEDLVMNAADTVVASLTDTTKFHQHRSLAPAPFMKAYLEDVDRLGVLTEPFARILATGAAWGEPHHLELWTRAMQRVANARIDVDGTFQEVLVALWRLPALLTLYVAGLVALARNRYEFIRSITTDGTTRKRHRESIPLVSALHLWSVVPDEQAANAVAHLVLHREALDDDGLQAILEGRATRYYAPMSMALRALAKPYVVPLIADQAEYESLFERFEVLIDLIMVDAASQTTGYAAGGSYGTYATERWRQNLPEHALREEFDAQSTQWAPIRAQLFGGDVNRASDAFTKLIEDLKKVRGQRW